MAINTVSSTTSSGATSSSSISAANDPAAMQDRFLKLLVAQMDNQDPLNPMDNAQMTSQMAQINTVNGIQQLNETLKSMAQQFTSMQVLQSASMVGNQVLIKGSTLVPDAGVAQGAIDLEGAADSVKVEILSPTGKVLDAVNMGTQEAGRVPFSWDASKYQGDNPTVRVTATRNGQNVAATTLVSAKVVSVGQENGLLSVQLQGRSAVAYSDIKAFL